MHSVELDKIMLAYDYYPHMYNVWRAYLHCSDTGEPLPKILQKQIDKYLRKKAIREISRSEDSFESERSEIDAKAYIDLHLVEWMDDIINGHGLKRSKKTVDAAAIKIEELLEKNPFLPSIGWETIRRKYFSLKK